MPTTLGGDIKIRKHNLKKSNSRFVRVIITTRAAYLTKKPVNKTSAC